MLDSETKRRIDSCRDILVGKVPDPKSQVEQITIALIYKFMDDMDAEAEELGGSRTFFAGEFGKYGWAKLMAPNMGGFDILALYSEAIQKMNENDGVPPLFRDIFKNAYLPYRDPETLRSFLKEIDSFTYDHSERLGDAFEYLLSVLGSQGDAGQFRTPRHIIDFMVEVIDPKKDETILDPACGTAGFLISSYKHILKHNSTDYREKDDHEAYDDKGVPLEMVTLDSPLHYKGDLLTPDERKRLAAALKGYDISPDMVRLSLVNLYLHGFTDPHIIEYDTLTSEERWNDYSDIILANPPFMSPKGGIKPHKRFSVQATRSEVLFVDYIAEHLTPTGRAAVIVPEGIIFQSGSGYKKLREMLIKTQLVAVISLPAGVFNPYSGVKTSILIMDKRLSKKTDSILFAKIENDGFNLGAQRRAIGGSHLPAAARNIKAWLDGVRSDSPLDLEGIPNLHLVEKARIAENGDWNLSAERYRSGVKVASAYEMVELGAVADLYQPKTITSKEITEVGQYKVFGANGIIGYFSDYNHEEPEVLMTCRGATCGTINMSEPKSWITGNAMVIHPTTTALNKNFIFFLLKSSDMSSVITGAAQPQITRQSLAPYKIPLPPLDVQKEIVAEIESYQKIIDGARQVVESYKPRIQVDPDWQMVELSSEAEWITKGTTPTTHGYKFQNSGINFIKIECINDVGEIDLDRVAFIDEECHELFKRSQLKENDILFSIAGTKMGITGFVTKKAIPANTNQALAIIRVKQSLVPRFAFHYLRSAVIQSEIESIKVGVAQFNLSLKQVSELRIPLPDLETQRVIVAEIEEEQRLVNANKELIRLFEDKIKATINRVWGEEQIASNPSEEPQEPTLCAVSA
ncbi:MAG: N-6 DNA methylase [Gallionellaceae bacterium]|jgi:type I restriction enzyme M protein